jgi:hypothetical protein
MKKIALLVIFILVAGVVFCQEEVFSHIDYFIQNFPQTNQEARDKLASWGYIKINEQFGDYSIEYITKFDLYQLSAWPQITNSNKINFYFEFYFIESPDFYKLYREAINHFTETYKNFSVKIENNNHIFYPINGDIYFAIGYSDTQHLTIGINKRKKPNP